MTDIEIWKKINKGDKKAFEALYRLYFSPLLHYALSLQYDEELVKDCLQDLFLKIFISSQKMNASPYIKAYLFKSLRNALIDKSKLVSKLDFTGEYLLNLEISDTRFDHIFQFSDDEVITMNKLSHSLEKLSENQRTALYLKYIQEFSWKEMSSTLDISEQSCMNLIGRTIQKLRKLILQ